MKYVSVLVPEGDISLTNVEGVHHIFSEVNKALVRTGREPAFELQLVGKKKNNLLKENFFSIYPNRLTDETFRTDMVIIPALHGDIAKSLELNKDLVPWVLKQYRQGAEVASLCTGAFLLAATGLLNGKDCATHWVHADDFREMFPEANLLRDEIMTCQNGLYTSGAAYSYLNLLLYLVEKYAGRDMMVLISKMFAIDTGRQRQSHFIIFQGYKYHKDDNILRAQEFIENHYQQRITVDQLALLVSLGRRSFERRFKMATSNSVVEYIQRVKVEAAKKLLEDGGKNVNEVMYDIGYNDNKTFRDVFKKMTGMSPLDYRTRYTRDIVHM